MKLSEDSHRRVVELVEAAERGDASPLERINDRRYRLHYDSITVRLPESEGEPTRVAFRWRGEALVEFERDAGPGDTLELWSRTGRHAGAVEPDRVHLRGPVLLRRTP